MESPAGQYAEPAVYFFLVFGFETVFGLAADFLDLEETAFGVGAIFLADEGLEARLRLEADILAFAAEVFFDVAVFTATFLSDRGSGSVFTAAEAGAAGMDAICLAASRQLGKKSSIRWREMELARRQRGQCAS
ncbi:MAG: hypothetical protein DCC59_13535 [Chloroflexi bacterium]|nr:hypothetical protein [Chloroflexi bacterium CFX1]MCQ3953208.1 hypothetical protein [Chloroflexota bacterium]RIK50458.1 MAG: hypothetical protein DCC59_13535 [Chloroflexota bacterium]